MTLCFSLIVIKPNKFSLSLFWLDFNATIWPSIYLACENIASVDNGGYKFVITVVSTICFIGMAQPQLKGALSRSISRKKIIIELLGSATWRSSSIAKIKNMASLLPVLYTGWKKEGGEREALSMASCLGPAHWPPQTANTLTQRRYPSIFQYCLLSPFFHCSSYRSTETEIKKKETTPKPQYLREIKARNVTVP